MVYDRYKFKVMRIRENENKIEKSNVLKKDVITNRIEINLLTLKKLHANGDRWWRFERIICSEYLSIACTKKQIQYGITIRDSIISNVPYKNYSAA